MSSAGFLELLYEVHDIHDIVKAGDARYILAPHLQECFFIPNGRVGTHQLLLKSVDLFDVEVQVKQLFFSPLIILLVNYQVFVIVLERELERFRNLFQELLCSLWNVTLTFTVITFAVKAVGFKESQLSVLVISIRRYINRRDFLALLNKPLRLNKDEIANGKPMRVLVALMIDKGEDYPKCSQAILLFFSRHSSLNRVIRLIFIVLYDPIQCPALALIQL